MHMQTSLPFIENITVLGWAVNNIRYGSTEISGMISGITRTCVPGNISQWLSLATEFLIARINQDMRRQK